jgi:hypothetical protein
MTETKMSVALTLANGSVVFPGSHIPLSHIFVEFERPKQHPQLANAKLLPPKGVEVIVSGLQYKFAKRNYPLLKEYGIVCIYQNGWITPLLREANSREKDIFKFSVYHAYKKTIKAGPDNLFWPIVRRLNDRSN